MQCLERMLFPICKFNESESEYESFWGGGGWPEFIPRVGLNFQLKSSAESGGGSPEFIPRVGLNFQLKSSAESFWGWGWPEFIPRVGLNF